MSPTTMYQTTSQTVSVLALPYPLILFPGSTVHVSLHNRPDLIALLATCYKSSNKSALIGCVPLASFQDHLVSSSTKLSILSYGTLARIVGIRGRGRKDQAVVLKGVGRFRIEYVLQHQPYIAARILIIEPSIDSTMSEEIQHELRSQWLWTSQSMLATYLAAAVIQRDGLHASQTISKVIGRHHGDAGTMADALVNMIGSDFGDRLCVLWTVDKQDRLSKVIEILERQIEHLTSSDLASSHLTSQNHHSWLSTEQRDLDQAFEAAGQDQELDVVSTTSLCHRIAGMLEGTSTRSKL